MGPKITNAVPSRDGENDKCNHQICNRTGESINKVTNSDKLPVHWKCKCMTAVGDRAKLHKNARNPTPKQLLAESNHDLVDVQSQHLCRESVTEFVRHRAE